MSPTVLWIIQILVALGFGLAGLGKVLQSKEKLLSRMAWVNDFSQSQVRMIGLLEVLGALGVILPAATGILPWLTPVAAAGLVLVMVGAMLTHIRRKEYPIVPVNLVLLILAALVVIGYRSTLPV